MLPYYILAISVPSAVLLYTLYSMRYLPALVAVLCTLSATAYICIIAVLLSQGGGDMLPGNLSAVLYGYAAYGFATLGVTLYYLKRRRNRVHYVLGKQLTPGSELDVALRKLYNKVAVTRLSEEDVQRCEDLYEMMTDFEVVIGEYVPLDKAQTYTYLVSEILALMDAHKRAIAND